MRRAPATRGGLEKDGNTNPCRRTSAASTRAKALNETDDELTLAIVTRGCDKNLGNDKAGGMDDIDKQPGEGAEQSAPLFDQEVPEGEEPRPAGADDELDDEFDDDLADGPAADGVPPWVGVVSGAGLGLVVVQALVLIGTVAQGLAVERFDGDFFHKLGVALLSNVGSANGLMLLVAAVLAGLPSLLGVPSTEVQRRRRAITFGLVAVLSVILIIGTPLAVRARVRVLDVSQQSVDALARRVLATYVAGTLGSALVALGTALGLARLNRPELDPS